MRRATLVFLLCLLIVTSVRAQLLRSLPTATGIPFPQKIAPNGTVVGYVSVGAIDAPRVWTLNGSAYVEQTLPTVTGFSQGGANAINASGMIAGYGQDTTQSNSIAVVWNPSGSTWVPTQLDGNTQQGAYGINASGSVAGFTLDTTAMGTPSNAKVWPALAGGAHGAQLLPVPVNTQESAATTIDDAGNLYGYRISKTGALEALVWENQPSGYAAKTVIANDATLLTAVNQYGTGAGVYAGEKPLVMVPFEGDYYAINLPMNFGADDGASDDVNNNDVLVGYAKDPTSGVSGQQAAIWIPTDTEWLYTNLDVWLDQKFPSTGLSWTLQEATGITDNGLVTGRGLFNGQPRGFVLDVSSLLPEPSLAFAMGCSMLISSRRSFRLSLRNRRSSSCAGCY